MTISLEYKADAIKRYCYHSVTKPVDVEVFTVSSHGIKLNYKIEATTYNQDYIEVQFTEDNYHISLVQIFKNIKVCSCEQYCKKECGSCKHIGVLNYLINSNTYVPEEVSFSKSLNSEIRNLKISKENRYLIYDSFADSIIKIGNGNNEIKSVSLITKEKHPSYLFQPDKVSLNLPYKVNDEITLRDYQGPILENMLTAKRAACCMAVGSGKTLTSIAGMQYIINNGLFTNSMLILCPKSVLVQWQKEIQRALGLDSTILTNRRIYGFVHSEEPRIGLCTFQTFARNVDLLSSGKYSLVIADEIQFIRNDESKTWAAFKKLRSDFFWGLSGTFIENRLDDLYNIMDVITPGLLGSKWKFESKFKKLKSVCRTKCLYHNEVQNKDDLKKLISNNIFSYQLKLPEPNHIRHYTVFDLESKKLHNSYIEQANILISKSLQNPLTRGEKLMLQSFLLRARQCCNGLELIDKVKRPNTKVQKILDIIDEICIEKNEKIVVFSEWTTMLDIIQRETKNLLHSVQFNGDLSSKQRDQMIEEFKNNPDCKVFFSSDAGGVGIDGLQIVCNNILHTELPWNPAKIDQRIGRLNRIGQNEKVNSYYVIMKSSIEEKMDTTLAEKRKIRTDTLF